MARVNVTIPDDLLARARAARLNVSRVASTALADELDRRAKITALDVYLTELETELGPVPQAEREAAAAWAERITARPSAVRPAHAQVASA